MKRLIRKLVDFHKDLINANTPTSHRRYLSIFFAYNAVLIAYFDQFSIYPLNTEVFISLLSASIVYAGLTAWSAKNALQAKSDVATEIVKNDAAEDTNQTAKEIVQSDKPQ